MMPRRSTVKTSNDIWLAPSMNEITPKELRAKISQARRGLAVGLKPDLVLEGSGGTYFMKDASRSKIGVFKPADEEPYAENNPRGYLRQPDDDMTLRAGIIPGESCFRELAAYLIDHDGFSGVPMTTLVEARHPAFNMNGSHLNVSQGGAAMGAHSIFPSATSVPSHKSKLGSFQEFVKHECTIDDVSPSKLSREEVHKIAILDIRIMNADRNAANLLVRRKPDDTLELVPIDHGYCLRSVCDVSWMDWCWLDWPQIKEPLCDAHKDYIQNIDIEADACLLRDRLQLCQEAIDYFRASSSLLKAGVAAGLTLYDIAILCCRNDNLAEEPSMMERLFEMASELAHVAVENERWHHSAASRALVDQLVPRPHANFVDNSQARRFSRSISSIEMSKLPSHPSDHSLNRDENLELMAALSDSDSSSDIAEDCNEWAAELIADLTELKISPQGRPNRSSSVGSDDSSTEGNTECSAKGFWVIAPGSAKAKASEHDSVQWTPKISPRMHIQNLDMEHLDLNLPFSSDNVPKKSNTTDIKSPTVSFAVNSSFIPPATVNVANYKSDTHTKTNDIDAHKAENGGNGMIRSKSYSSLPAASVARFQGRLFNFLPSLKGSPYKGSTEYETYRTYFHKFIDLVIVRETTNALYHSKRAS